MSEQLKFIVTELNKLFANKKYNLISFDSLNAEQLLQVLTDVLAEVDPSNRVDVRSEDPEQTTVRILEMLRILKYKPGSDTSPAVFRQGLIQGDKQQIHPLLDWLFHSMADLKKRAYLAQYLVKVEVPLEILADADVASLYEQYEQLMEEFKAVHKDSEALKSSGLSTGELKADISTMEKEKDIVLKRIEKMQRKMEDAPNKAAMLEACHNVRLEQERSKELATQRQEQQGYLSHADQRLLRLQHQLRELRGAAMGATPEGLLQRLDEETNVATYIVMQKLPKEIHMRHKEVEILHLVNLQPAMSRDYLDMLNDKVAEVNSEVSSLVEQHMANPGEDKLAPFRQQAAIIARKKESTAEQLSELRIKMTSMQEELGDKQGRLSELAGDTVLRGDEFKRYVNKLRGRSSVYKRHRAELAALKAEAGVLTRTLDILQSRQQAILHSLAVEEAQRGVSGFRAAEDRLEQVSGEKAGVDLEKGHTLEDMSSLVLQLTQSIASKKAQLAPVIKELRPLREQCQELTLDYEQKKRAFDTTAAGLESATAKLQQEVQALQEDVVGSDSLRHLLQAEAVILQVQQDRLAEEIRLYVSTSPSQPSLRDKLTTKMGEAEKLSRQLKEDQQSIKDNQTNRARQMKLWTDLHNDASTAAKKRGPWANLEQLSAIKEYMALHPEFANGKFMGPQGKSGQDAQWARLASKMNTLGPMKSVLQWKAAWRDLKCSVRRKNAANVCAQRQTGNSSTITPLTEEELLLLGTIGHTSSAGVPNYDRESGFTPSTAATAELPPSTAATDLLPVQLLQELVEIESFTLVEGSSSCGLATSPPAIEMHPAATAGRTPHNCRMPPSKERSLDEMADHAVTINNNTLAAVQSISGDMRQLVENSVRQAEAQESLVVQGEQRLDLHQQQASDLKLLAAASKDQAEALQRLAESAKMFLNKTLPSLCASAHLHWLGNGLQW